MAQRYFDKFPQVYYSNNIAVNITERAAVMSSVLNDSTTYYSYDISNGKRPDQFSDSYYNDQYMSWLLYLTNDIIDPYYGWYLTQEQFNDHLKKKYNTQSVSTLQNKIAFYRNNWYNDDTITPVAYAALPTELHKYWQPYYNPNNAKIMGYFRKQIDWTINTNSIVSYACNASSFVNNEIVTVTFDSTHSGRGQVVTANSTNLVIQHTSGTTLANPTVVITGSSFITGSESLANVVFTQSTSLANNIPSNEVVYWDPVSIYDSERESNESNKSIKVIDRTYSDQIANALKKVLA